MPAKKAKGGALPGTALQVENTCTRNNTTLPSETPSGAKVRALLALPDGEREITVYGQAARTLAALVLMGRRGLEVLDFTAGPAYRLAMYVCQLRNAGVPIATHRTPHDGFRPSWHARYALTCPVEILDIAGLERTHLPRGLKAPKPTRPSIADAKE
jgi:hypothetical protein